LDDFGYYVRGVSVVNFCPICGKPLLDERDTRILGEMLRDLTSTKNPAGARELWRDVSSLLRRRGAAMLAMFAPRTEELAELFDYRIVFYPVCSECHRKYFKDPEKARAAVKIAERTLIKFRRLLRSQHYEEASCEQRCRRGGEMDWGCYMICLLEAAKEEE